MRPQEYVALPHYNVLDTAVKVDRALESGGTRISVTKTPAGRRTIDLSPETEGTTGLLAIMKRQNSCGKSVANPL